MIVFEPFYENYGPDAILSGATPRYVTLHAPDWTFDPDELAAAFNDRTKAIILNTPNNPTGKVFTRDELETIAALCRKWDVIAITDEIYEHIIYDGARHVPIATLEGMADRTVTINSLSKTLQRDRLAGRLGDRAAGADRRDPQGARLPDGRRARRRCRRPAPSRSACRTATTPSSPPHYQARRDRAASAILERRRLRAAASRPAPTTS